MFRPPSTGLGRWDDRPYRKPRQNPNMESEEPSTALNLKGVPLSRFFSIQDRDGSKRKTLLGLGLLFSILALLNVGWTLRYISTHETTRGKVITGETTYSGTTDRGGSVSTFTAAVIEYELPDGKTSTFQSFRRSEGIHPPMGLDYQSELTVYYPASNPYAPRAGDFLSMWRFALGLALAALACFAFIRLLESD